MHERRAKGIDEPLPLQFLLLRVHGAGDIHRQNKREIDLGFGSGPVRDEQAQAGHCDNSKYSTRRLIHPILLWD